MSSFPGNRGTEGRTVKGPVKKLLNKYGWFWWMPAASQFGRSGVSDFLAIKKGMFLAVETKYGKNDPTPMQIAFLNSVRAEDHLAFVVRESTLLAFGQFLNYLDQSIEYAGRQEVAPANIGGAMLDAIKAMTETEVLDPARLEKEMKKAARGKKHDPENDGDGADRDGGHDPG